MMCVDMGHIEQSLRQLEAVGADMLHLDLWWRGINLLRDSGSFSYYDPAENWDRHFLSTAAHNTLTVGGAEQMIKGTRFRWHSLVESRCLGRRRGKDIELWEGEHYGYRRLPSQATHRRTIGRLGEECWLVVDDVLGAGEDEDGLDAGRGPVGHCHAQFKANVDGIAKPSHDNVCLKLPRELDRQPAVCLHANVRNTGHHLLDNLLAALLVEQRVLFRVLADADDHLVEELGCAFYDIQVAVGYRIKRAWEKRGS